MRRDQGRARHDLRPPQRAARSSPKQLIQRLVTSNPSPAYVGRVSAVFANNGSGVRGDLKAVVRAILLDTEARSDDSADQPRLRASCASRCMRLTGWARAFGANSPSNAWAIGDTAARSTRLGQSPGPQRRASSTSSAPATRRPTPRYRDRRAGRAGVPDHQRAVGGRLRQLSCSAGRQRHRRLQGRIIPRS